VPATAVPVTPILGRGQRHHDLVPFADADLVVAAGAAVLLHRLVRLNVVHLDAGSGVIAHVVLVTVVCSHRPSTVPAMEGLLVDRNDGIVTLTIDRPHRKNAVTGEMWVGLSEVFDEIAARRDDRVLVITGSGDAFCSGADLANAAAGDTPQGAGNAVAAMRYVGRAALRLHELPIPTIAAVNGVAAGAGCNLALGCDLIIASDRARFTEIFAKRGLALDFGGSWLLPRLVGIHKAKQLAFLAEIIDAAAAERIGIVNWVVPYERFAAEVASLAHRVAAMPPLQLAVIKRQLNDGLSRSMSEAIEFEDVAQALMFTSGDTAEAMIAFVQKREPRFTGE
jgi:enoyl-CoA hydratase/carnithine racemase